MPGFTLIELMLAMTFISVLLIAIAMTTIQISNIYNKGVTLREVNQSGRSISEDLQRTIASSEPFNVVPKSAGDDDSLSRYVVHPGGGRLCLGQSSYAWNYGDALAGGAGAPAIYNRYDDTGSTPVRFAKVSDANGSLCSESTAPIPQAGAVELLSGGDRDLVLHDFSILRTKDEASTSQAIYAVSMVIGTNERALLTANDTSCKPPAEAAGGEHYCSVNQFDIIARAGNRAGGN